MCCRVWGVGGGHDSERYLGRPLGIEENVGLSVAHFFHTANLHLRVITVDPETWRKTKFRTDSGVSSQNLQGPRPGDGTVAVSVCCLTSFCVVAVCSVVP